MATRGGAAGMALGGWDLMVRPSRWWWRAGGGRTGERRQQVLVGTAERVPTAPPGLEADLEGERSAVGPSLGHGRPRPRPVRSTRIGMTAATGAPLSGFGVGACRVARGTPSPERRMPRCLTRGRPAAHVGERRRLPLGRGGGRVGPRQEARVRGGAGRSVPLLGGPVAGTREPVRPWVVLWMPRRGWTTRLRLARRLPSDRMMWRPGADHGRKHEAGDGMVTRGT